MTGKKFYSNGKLLITGEYLVMRGALSLALPLRFGQSLEIEETGSGEIHWESFDTEGPWFEACFSAPGLELKRSSDENIASKLQSILESVKRLKPGSLEECTGLNIKTIASFNRKWGLGTSSTLLNNLSEWLNIPPFDLLWANFPGSGYDIACARASGPIIYRLKDDIPDIRPIKYDPPFKHCLYFVFSGKKQDTGAGIEHFSSIRGGLTEAVGSISELTRSIISTQDFPRFADLLLQHEHLTGKILGLDPVGKARFPDFSGAVKSLGAWGGDFILAASDRGPGYVSGYFRKKGLDIIFPYREIVLGDGSGPFVLREFR